MNIAFYHPNMHLLGGGETVCLTLASHLSDRHHVTIYVTRPVDRVALEKFFNLKLGKVNFTVFAKSITNLPTMATYKQSLTVKAFMRKAKHYDLVIDTCSNGHFHKKMRAKTVCYIHFPNYTKKKNGWKALLNKLLIPESRMFTYDRIICNSAFTQGYVQKLTKKRTTVIYPPVDTSHFTRKKKERIITTIGRYSPEKKIEVLIDTFKSMEKRLKGYTFHIIGSIADEHYLEMLRRKAAGHNIKFHENMPHTEVISHLERTHIYWHARGYGEKDPAEYENFGITTVEAMAAGCTPIVINLGAQPEIVTNKELLWSTTTELEQKTIRSLTKKYSFDVSGFSTAHFLKRIDAELDALTSSAR